MQGSTWRSLRAARIPAALGALALAVPLASGAVSLPMFATASSSVPIKMVGVLSYASGNGGSAKTALPTGTTAGNVVVAAVETYPFAAITFASGWTRAFDGSYGNATHVALWYHVVKSGETSVVGTISPPTQLSMVTATFSGVDTTNPIDGAAGAGGLSAPGVKTTTAGALLVRALGSGSWQVKATPGTGATLAKSVNDNGNSSAALATQPTSSTGAQAGMVWTTNVSGAVGYAGTIALRPASPGTSASSPTPTTTPTTGTPSPSPSPTGTGTSSPTPTPTPTSTGTGSSSPTPAPTPTSTGTAAAGSAPVSPPAAVCGNGSVLDGPSSAPAGAVVVSPGQDLNAVTQAAAAGSTFWLAPGVYTLGSSQYSQVIPKAGDHYIGAPGAVLDGQHVNVYAFTQQAANVTIEHLTIRNFGAAGGNNNEGVVNHDAGPGWVIRYNTVTGNAGAGVFVGSGDTVSWNCLSGNGQYGFSAYRADGVSNVTIDHNEIVGNNTDNWEVRQPGCGCTGGGKFWATVNAAVTNNYVHDNHGVGLWADTNNVGFLFSGNYISGNDAEGVMYEISYNAQIVHNTFVRNGIVAGPGNPGFPTPAIYLSESGGDSRVAAPYGSTLLVSDNTFTDNWGGVVLWENADRFCNSPANTSGGTCTLVAPSENLSTNCAAGTINNQPYYGDCRWKTQNVSVTGNRFSVNQANVGSGCSASTSCGENGIFSNWGTYPTWSPYQGNVVEKAILNSQNNHFSNNTYTGPWTFLAGDTGTDLSLKAWQAGPYNQDAGSTSN